MHRKSVKKGFEFTLMVVGESGLGKSTLVNSLFLTDLYPDRPEISAAERQKQTVKLEGAAYFCFGSFNVALFINLFVHLFLHLQHQLLRLRNAALSFD